jgi:aerobic carbon-monoxide dehydrogenase medium subunit
MIPAAFGYTRPGSVDEAVQLLARNGGSKVIAGGHSLLPLLKLRLASAETLIDVGRLSELRGTKYLPDGSAEVGPLTTYAEIIEDTRLDWVREAVQQIGDRQVRNRGTVGGSIAHADPASDMPAIGLALDYSAVLRSTRGERVVPLDGFFQGPFETAMEPDELLVGLRRGPLPDGAGGAYQKLANPASGYAIVGIAAVVARAGGKISHARIGVTGVHEHAYRAEDVESALVGSDGSAAAIEAAAEHVLDDVEVLSDIHADAEYRSAMAKVYTRRAIETAIAASGA